MSSITVWPKKCWTINKIYNLSQNYSCLPVSLFFYSACLRRAKRCVSSSCSVVVEDRELILWGLVGSSNFSSNLKRNQWDVKYLYKRTHTYIFIVMFEINKNLPSFISNLLQQIFNIPLRHSSSSTLRHSIIHVRTLYV